MALYWELKVTHNAMNQLYSPEVQRAIDYLQDKKAEFPVDDHTGAIQCSIRGIAAALQVDNTNLGRLLKKLQTEGAAKDAHSALQTLAERGFRGAAKDSENTYVDEMQFALLVDYYAEASRKAETRKYCKLLRTAFVAVGARVLILQLHNLNPDYTPIAARLRKIEPKDILQVKGREIKVNNLIEDALKDMSIRYYRNVEICGINSISHRGHQKLDFYCPDIGEVGLAIKGYFQQEGGSGYQKISTYKDEILYRYPCPGILVTSGNWMSDNEHAAQQIHHARDAVFGAGKLRAVINESWNMIIPVLKQELAREMGEDTRGARFESLPREGLRIFAKPKPPTKRSKRLN